MGADVTILALRVATLVVLYGFLVALLAAMRRELRLLASEQPPMPALRVADQLVVIHAGSGSTRPGTIVELRGPTGIGRSSENQVVLDDEFVSGVHARLAPRDGSWWLTDLGSTNGTLLNDRPLGREMKVEYGDVVGIGGARLKLIRAGNPGESGRPIA